MPAAAPSAADALTRARAAFAAAMAGLGPFAPAPRMVVAVSGGPHSLALFLLLRDWGAALRPVIVDHGLRPDSAAEAAFVAAQLRRAGAAPRLVTLALPAGSAVQARARAARFAALEAIAAEEGRPWIALGHHAADQAETLALRREAGSGPDGLAGMAPASARGAALLIRPLLTFAPDALEAVVAQAGLRPVRDPSNANLAFARIRLRASLAAPATAALLVEQAGFAAARSDRGRAVAARLAVSMALDPLGFARLDLPALGADAVAVAALAAMVRVVGGGAYAPAGAAVMGLIARGQGSLGGAVLGRDGLLAREVAALAPPIPAEPGARWDGRWRFEGLAPGCEIAALGTALRPRGVPARVAAGLPALWHKKALVAVPTLGYPETWRAESGRFVFEPVGGPAAPHFPASRLMAGGPGHPI
jgi:tRNA(Ile)-lysidine synthase